MMYAHIELLPKWRLETSVTISDGFPLLFIFVFTLWYNVAVVRDLGGL